MGEGAGQAVGPAIEGNLAHERAARARAVLQLAEQRTGARSVTIDPAADVPTPFLVAAAAPAVMAVPGEGPDRRKAAVLSQERPPLAVPPGLAGVLPDGLRRGAVVAVLGSTSVLLGMLAAACADGGWAAIVGHPSVGLLAAAEAGVDLQRLALIPQPGPDVAPVVAALIDGIDVVVIGDAVGLVDGDRRRLAARARERGAALLSTQPWRGADLGLVIHPGPWQGAADGAGRLRSRTVTVERTGRGGAQAYRPVVLELPGLVLTGHGVDVPAAADETFAAPLQLVG